MTKPIRKTVITVTVLHPGEVDLDLMPLKVIAEEIDFGDFLGRYTVTSDEEVPPDKLKEEQLALGGDGTFFLPDSQPSPERG